MAAVNQRRIWAGAVTAGIVWNLWGFLIHTVLLGEERYTAAQQAGFFLQEARYPFFYGQWILVIFLLSYVIAWVYASVRATRGPGPRTALRVGFFVGFAAGFPTNFAIATWFPVGRIFPLGWMLELWVGAMLAALVAGWLYRD